MARTLLVDMELGVMEGGGQHALQGLRSALFRFRAGGFRICWVGEDVEFSNRAQTLGLLVDSVIAGARHTHADVYLSGRLERLAQAEHIPHRAWLDAGLPQAGHVLDESVALARTVGGWAEQYLLSQGVRPTLLRLVANNEATGASRLGRPRP